MLRERIEGKWIACFAEVFTHCGVKAGDAVAILSETQSRTINVELAELALFQLGARSFHVVVPTPRLTAPAPVRSTGASDARPFRVAGIPIYGTNGKWIRLPDDLRAHGKDERLPVRSLDDNVKQWELLVTELAGK